MNQHYLLTCSCNFHSQCRSNIGIMAIVNWVVCNSKSSFLAAANDNGEVKEEIHELLLSFAEAGATIVRLKGGIHWCLRGVGRKWNFCNCKVSQ